MSRFKAVIESELDARGMTQADLARASGVNWRTINNHLQGVTAQMHPKNQLKIAKALDFDSIDDLLDSGKISHGNGKGDDMLQDRLTFYKEMCEKQAEIIKTLEGLLAQRPK